MPSSPTALITGITGQDGSFLAELLLGKGYRVTGGRGSSPEASRGCSEHLRGQIDLVQADLLEPGTLRGAIEQTRPAEIYHFAAPSFVPASWERPSETLRAIVGSCTAILEGVRELEPSARVFVAASGSIFGEAGESPQREDTPCPPTTPPAAAQLAPPPPAGGPAARSRRAVRLLGHRLQPRVRAPARAIRHAQDQPRRRRHLAGHAGGADARVAGGDPRLVLRRRRRGGRLADAAAGAPRRLRAGQRR